MQETHTLERLLSLLSEEDRAIFDTLSIKLKHYDGDISQLDAAELKIIQHMEQKYADQFTKVDQDSVATAQNEPFNESELLQSPFAQKVKQLLARDLKERFSEEAVAVQFAFKNRWLPSELKDPIEATKIFNEYLQDISQANQWREELVGVNSDKMMAVGLTWFMVIFQLNRGLNS